MSSGNLFTQLPILDGSNWLAWSVDMKGWLQKEELWGFVAGDITEPSPVADSATISEKAQNRDQRNKWKLADKAAVGSMSLKLRKDIKLLYLKEEDTSLELWKKLKEAFGKVPFVQVYGYYKELTRFQFTGTQNPVKEFARWDLLITQLKEGGIDPGHSAAYPK